MEQWAGKVAVVTRVTDSIGTAIVNELLKYDIKVTGFDYDKSRLNDLSEKLPKEKRGNFYALQCDVCKEKEIKSRFQWIRNNVGPISILINNAEYFTCQCILEANSDLINNVFQMNVTAPIILAKEMADSLAGQNGHIININGTDSQSTIGGLYIYNASKGALVALSDGLRTELQELNCNIKVTDLTTGSVDITPIAHCFPTSQLRPSDVADGCILVLKTSADVAVNGNMNISFDSFTYN